MILTFWDYFCVQEHMNAHDAYRANLQNTAYCTNYELVLVFAWSWKELEMFFLIKSLTCKVLWANVNKHT